jgi:hypothetical protein
MTELLIFVVFADIVAQMPACSTLTTLIIAVLGEHLPGTIDGGARQHHDGYAGIAAALLRPKVQ